MNNNEEKLKNKMRTKNIARRVIAGFLAILMLLATMSTFIYYIIMYI